MVNIEAINTVVPPEWALLERKLIDLMEDAAQAMIEKYTDQSGVVYYADDVDDLYERFYNWSLFYAIGADAKLLEYAVKEWNATTRVFSDNREHPYFPWMIPQLHNEYYHLGAGPQDVPIWTKGKRWVQEWHHQSEGNMAFYDFGVACPDIAENVNRARRFAAMFMGEDPEAPNYDRRYKILRSPIHGGKGPLLKANLHNILFWLHGSGPHVPLDDDWQPKPMGVIATLYPVIKNLEDKWWENKIRREEIIKLFEHMALNGDIANSLGATAVVTNAYLYTGEEKYKEWVLEYTEAWMDRMRKNNGIMPDNVGPTGKIGENRDGQWWGGVHGWNHYQGFNSMFHSFTVAAECCLLLTGDFDYLELLRSQIKVLLDNAIQREDGQLLVPVRYGPDGWQYARTAPGNSPAEPMRMQELTHLYHASMSPHDYDLINQVRDGEKERDWNQVPSEGEKNQGNTEFARFQYYDGKNPDWPEKVLKAEYRFALDRLEAIRNDQRDLETMLRENTEPPNPVATKGLTQVTLGAPQSVYNGGLLRATVRYFDPDRRRPGLPLDVSALVDNLEPKAVGLHLVNTNQNESRKLIVQSGAFGEHHFSHIRIRREAGKGKPLSVNSEYFSVCLPPATAVQLDIGLERFVNKPGYSFPPMV